MLLLTAAAGAIGCGNRQNPTINPINPTGPAGSAAGGYALVLTQPALQPAASATNPCPLSTNSTNNPYSQPAVATVIDFSGDSVLAQATVGYGPITSAIAPSSNEVYSLNCDGTISGIPLTPTLQSNNVTTTTLFAATTTGSTGGQLSAPSIQTNMIVQNSAIYVTNPGLVPNANGGAGSPTGSVVGALTAGSPPSLLQAIPVAPALVALSGSPTSQRVYAISQGATGSNVNWGQCTTPNAVTGNGEVDSIDTVTNAVSKRIPVGNCPVFGLTTPDGLRTFILNRGSGTVTVINSQGDALDMSFNATGTIHVGAGPVYAAYFPQRALLVTANYDSGTVSFINVPLDSFGNDVPGVFGTVLKTVNVGANPAALSFLGDGSRVYVVLQGDPANSAATGAIAVVNATSFNLQNTIAVPGHPRSIASTYNNPEGKVYVVAPDSQLLTVLRTDTDTISAQLQLQGCGVDVHTNYQYVGQSNIAGSAVSANTIVNMSNSPGSGAPTISFTPTTASLCQ